MAQETESKAAYRACRQHAGLSNRDGDVKLADDRHRVGFEGICPLVNMFWVFFTRGYAWRCTAPRTVRT